jgi:hypothetical protein
MRSRFRSYLTFTNVASAIALFVSLAGGTAYAVDEWTGANIQDGSLTTADYKNKDIRSADIRDDSSAGGGLNAADLRPGSVAGSEVLNGSLGTADTDPLASGANSFSVVPIDLSTLAGAGPQDSPWLSSGPKLFAVCHQSGIVQFGFQNPENSPTATLNWLYGNGTSVFAGGVALAASSAKSFDFENGRIEGEFIYADADSKFRFNLHMVDLSTRCEVLGTAMRAAD